MEIKQIFCSMTVIVCFMNLMQKLSIKTSEKIKNIWSKYISKILWTLWPKKQAIEMYKDKASSKTITELVKLKSDVYRYLQSWP